MGIFSRKDKPSRDGPRDASLTGTRPKTSLPDIRAAQGSNRSGYSSGPSTPMTPTIPKINLPKPPDPTLDPAGYLRSLPSVRERSKIITQKALKNELTHFNVDMSKFPDVVGFVSRIIKRDYDAPFTSIPPHGRYQHFGVGGRDRIAQLLSTWDDVDPTEKCRRLIDLFLVSVLLDAGAGLEWSYTSLENKRTYRRSEGIAIATLEMFKSGLFAGGRNGNKYQVDKEGLRNLTVDKMAKGLQSRPGNEIAGLEGRTQVIIRLADALEQSTEYFGRDGRPGNMLDYLLSHPSTQVVSVPIVLLPVLWNVLMNGLAPIWPSSRTAIDGVSLGDAWPCSTMPRTPETGSWGHILPFHKLTQWLTYSLMQPMQSILKIHFAGTELLTGLPEYRNGGLFIDLGVLTLKDVDMSVGLAQYQSYCKAHGTKPVEVAPMFRPDDDVIVEWRGVTVGFLDLLCVEVNKALKSELAGNELSLAQLLEAGSWKGGREIAEVSRPNTKEPPILIESDGTVF